MKSGLIGALSIVTALASAAHGEDERTKLMMARTLHVSIDRPPREVYEFVIEPTNVPKWARGLGSSVSQTAEGWIVETPEGPAKLAFVERNELGVADHTVTLKSGPRVLVPVRVLPNGDGSEVMLTVFRLPGVSAKKFAEDLGAVERDLRSLKAVLEGSAR